MSFATDRPFYPYREPSDHLNEPGRTLRVHVVAPERAFPALEGDLEWGANELFAARLEAPSSLLGDGLSEVAGDLWLTSFLDSTSLRESADLRFELRPAEEVRPPPIIVEGTPTIIPIPIEPAVLLGGGFWWWRRRAKAKAST